MRRQNTLEVRDWGEKKSSLILAGCRGKAGGARPALFVTLLILGQQEKLHWHHPHTTGEGKWQFDCPTSGQNLQSFCLVFCDRFLDCTSRPNLIQVPGKKGLFADFWKWSNPTRRDWENLPSCSKGEASLGCQWSFPYSWFINYSVWGAKREMRNFSKWELIKMVLFLARLIYPSS